MTTKLTEAQRLALEAANAGPLTIDRKGWLCFDGADGSRHKGSAVFAAQRKGLLRYAPKGPFERSSQFVITAAGRALLARSGTEEGATCR